MKKENKFAEHFLEIDRQLSILHSDEVSCSSQMDCLKAEKDLIFDSKMSLWDEESRLKTEYYKYLAESGLTKKEIAKKEGICVHTVYRHIRYGGKMASKDVRRAVLTRDAGMCQTCFRVRRPLHVHHIGSPQDHSMSNLITLCAKCHKDAHKKTADMQVQIAGMKAIGAKGREVLRKKLLG